MDKTFVRKSFYIAPPEKDASAEEWMDWLEKDKEAARVAKAKFTRSRKSQQVEATHDMSVAKIGGVYKQVPSLGFVGGDDGELGRLEPIVEAQQENDIDQARQQVNSIHRRGGSRRYRNKAKREQIRMLRKAKYRGR